jgi:endonuclease-3
MCCNNSAALCVHGEEVLPQCAVKIPGVKPKNCPREMAGIKTAESADVKPREMAADKRAAWIIGKLKALYPAVRCELDYDRDKPFQLLIATRLSAQCTDKRVNQQTKPLFEKYPDVRSFANARTDDVAEIIHPCGLFNAKAKDIVCMCKKLILQFDGNIPDNLEDLLSLPGVGRKTANLVLGELFGKPAYIADTHVLRLSRRLGLTGSDKPSVVEEDLRRVIPEEESLAFCHRIVRHGREVCHSRQPECERCALRDGCLHKK